jgi:hypothetical protein
VNDQINEIRVKLEEEKAGADTRWHEIFTGPRMLYRTLLGITLQAGQQLTGKITVYLRFLPILTIQQQAPTSSSTTAQQFSTASASKTPTSRK